jgi:dTMP kinase
MTEAKLNPNHPQTEPGKFIVIEGSDSAGKHTQAKLLVKHLQRQNIDTELISFPQYDTDFGKLVARYLRGEFGSLSEVPPEIPSLLYALDRYQAKGKLEEQLKDGKWLVADRYTQSNLAHQGAKLSGEAREKLLSWIEQVEQRLPQPDLVVYLHVPVELAQTLMKTRQHKSYLGQGEKQDIHEVDTVYQQRVVEMYLSLANNRDNWAVIECVDSEKQKLLAIEVIHHRIAKALEQNLHIKSHH